MCGIAGLIATGSAANRSCDTLAQMLDPLRMRGPDSEGTWHGRAGPWEIALGHRRLAILDLTAAADQPMRREALTLIYNGEVYNYVELRRELETCGHVFHTRSDTEVLLAAYQQWGAECLARLNGMFAFALWDAVAQTLFCARDRAGEKPFYYHAGPSCFALASEIKSLLRVGPAVPCAPNLNRIAEFLDKPYQVLGEETCFEGIRELLPAHQLTVQLKDGGLSVAVRRYWDFPAEPSPNGGLPADELRRLFDDAVRIRLRSDVPIGTCLSGGVDSPSVAAAVANFGREAEAGHFQYVGVHAYAPVPGADERPYVEHVVRRLNLKMSWVEVTARGCLEELDDLVYRQETPFLGPSVYAQRCVFRRAADLGLKVMLDGQGADELFGGYDWAAPRAIAAWWREQGWRAALRQWRNFRGARFPSWGLLARSVRYRLRGAAGEFPDDLRPALRASFARLSLPALLRYADRNSMSFGVEARLPFLDHRLIEATARLNAADCADGGYTKAVLRRAMHDRVPHEVLYRKDKTAFAVPAHQWVQGELRPAVREAVADRCWREFDLPTIRPLLRAATAETEGRAYNHAAWKALCLCRWRQRFFGARP